MKKVYLIAIAMLVGVVLILAGCTPAPAPISAPTAGQAAVEISGFAFHPQTLSVSTASKVVWTNKDSVAHTVTSRGGLFDSGGLSPGDTFSYAFSERGTFEYYCAIHPSMTGKAVVE